MKLALTIIFFVVYYSGCEPRYAPQTFTAGEHCACVLQVRFILSCDFCGCNTGVEIFEPHIVVKEMLYGNAER